MERNGTKRTACRFASDIFHYQFVVQCNAKVKAKNGHLMTVKYCQKGMCKHYKE